MSAQVVIPFDLLEQYWCQGKARALESSGMLWDVLVEQTKIVGCTIWPGETCKKIDYCVKRLCVLLSWHEYYQLPERERIKGALGDASAWQYLLFRQKIPSCPAQLTDLYRIVQHQCPDADYNFIITHLSNVPVRHVNYLQPIFE